MRLSIPRPHAHYHAEGDFTTLGILDYGNAHPTVHTPMWRFLCNIIRSSSILGRFVYLGQAADLHFMFSGARSDWLCCRFLTCSPTCNLRAIHRMCLRRTPRRAGRMPSVQGTGLLAPWLPTPRLPARQASLIDITFLTAGIIPMSVLSASVLEGGWFCPQSAE